MGQKLVESYYKNEIAVIEDTVHNCDGGLFIYGDFELIDEHGTVYNKQSRMALCRCGASKTKPFCDGKHIDSYFIDENKYLYFT